MIRLNRLLSTVILAAIGVAQPVSAARLDVDVAGIRVQQGEVKLAVYSGEEAWKGGAPVTGRRAAPDGSEVLRFSFDDLPAGRYAIRVMHDENGNGKLDTNLLGIPKEAYGASNNPKVMRAPRFDEAAFDLGGADVSLNIELN